MHDESSGNLRRMVDAFLQHGERFRSQLDRLCPVPETLVDEIERVGSEMNATFVRHGMIGVTEALLQRYD